MEWAALVESNERGDWDGIHDLGLGTNHGRLATPPASPLSAGDGGTSRTSTGRILTVNLIPSQVSQPAHGYKDAGAVMGTHCPFQTPEDASVGDP